MSRRMISLLAMVACGTVLLSAPIASAQDDKGDENKASLSLSVGGDGDVATGGRPTHRRLNVHFSGGFAFALDNKLSDAMRDDKGGQVILGLDIVLIEPLALSLQGGVNPLILANNDTAGFRSAFMGGGFRLRLFSDDNGALADGGTAAGNLWIDAHFNYFAHLFEDHGGYDVGIGYEFAIAKDFNMGPYFRFQHVPWGEGQQYMLGSVGLQISIGGQLGPDDKDGDGILDNVDECPDVPEDMDGFEDENGCPDTDNDNDGILDADDQCPDVAGVAKNNGCPDNDIDGDGILNDVDKCPEEAEDKDEFEDEDGCPDPDNDQDGVLDGDDKCPTEKEDKDGFEDEDGCPDPDNDQDGILDVDDQCPNEAETKNGKDDEDGCPDLVRVVGRQIKILEKVYFATNKDKILDQSFELLDQVAAVIVAKPEMRVRVEGHTDDVGKDDKNLKLSQRRADSVKDYLVGKGVAKDRLEATGLGETKPIADNATKEGKAENRRVEFHIIPAPVPEAAPEDAAPAEEAPAEVAPAAEAATE